MDVEEIKDVLAKNKLSKKRLHSLFSLSSSYIHDAANLFGLAANSLKEIKINLEQSNLDEKSLEKLRNLLDFLKGSEYHFKETFSELKHLASSSNAKDFTYPKSVGDLKDILHLEMMEIFTQDRLSFEDNVYQNNALFYGNFSLITKAIFNLLENALKHTKSKVLISLDDAHDYWKLKIYSEGSVLEPDLEKSLQLLKPSSSGHGLESVAEILKYHDVQIDINSFREQGMCINLFFKKYLKNMDLAQREAKSELLNLNAWKLSALILGMSCFLMAFLFFSSWKNDLEFKLRERNLAQKTLKLEEERVLNRLRYLFTSEQDIRQQYAFTEKLLQTNQIPVKKIFLKKLILKEKFLKFSNLNVSDIDPYELYSFIDHDFNNWYAIDYFFAESYRMKRVALAHSQKVFSRNTLPLLQKQCFYEFKAFIEQFLSICFKDFETRILESDDLDLGLRYLLVGMV